MAYIYDIADTWNASGTTFTAIKMSVTDTASAAASLLMDLQVGGVSRFNVTKAGGLVSKANSIDWGDSGEGYLTITGTPVARLLPGARISLGANALSFASSVFGTADVSILRDAANTLAQRNGVNAQAFNLYNTYTDASNYERGFMSWSHTANRLVVGTGALGTGTNRAVQLGAGNGFVSIFTEATARVDAYVGQFVIYNTTGTERLRVDAAGSVQISTPLTVATLPSTPLAGMIARVTNATAPVVGTTVAGGGAAAALCWYNGTNWTVIGV